MRSSIPLRSDGLGRSPISGFTLLEMLVAFAVLGLILIVLVEFVSDVERTWKSSSNDPYAEAESAFETVAQNLSAATLESYQDYADKKGFFRTSSTSTFVPDHLARRSDLDFVCGPTAGNNGLLSASGRVTMGCALFFTAPLGYTQSYAHTGMERLFNAAGYFVEFGDDDAMPLFLAPSNPRWRLKQVLQPAESLQIYASTPSPAWIQPLVQSTMHPSVLAENIVTLIVLPERGAHDPGTPLSPDFRYDSRDASQPLTRNQLPPRVRLVLLAMDATSAQLLANQYGSKSPPLVADALFHQSSQLDADLASLDKTLTSQKIGHRLFQREITLNSAAWSETSSQ